MDIKKVTTGLLWVSLMVVVLLGVMQAWHVKSFLEKSEPVNAVVVDISRGSVLYDVTFRFKTKFDTVLDVEVSAFSDYKAGDVVNVLYNRFIPAQVYINSFLGLWFDLLVYLSMALFVFVVTIVFKYISNWDKNKKKNILKTGNHIYTKFEEVEAVLKIKKDGKHPYRIISSWYDQGADKTYHFKSEYLWINPIEYILDESIMVKIDRKNKRKYIMDLSFLPDNIRLN